VCVQIVLSTRDSASSSFNAHLAGLLLFRRGGRGGVSDAMTHNQPRAWDRYPRGCDTRGDVSKRFSWDLAHLLEPGANIRCAPGADTRKEMIEQDIFKGLGASGPINALHVTHLLCLRRVVHALIGGGILCARPLAVLLVACRHGVPLPCAREGPRRQKVVPQQDDSPHND